MNKERIEVSRIYIGGGKKKAICKSWLSTAKTFWDISRITCDNYKNQHIESEIVKVIYYLIGHSLELIFKAFLFNAGYSKERLKNKIRHNLKELNEKAKQHGLAILNDEDIRLINELNEYYKNKEIEYEETDFSFKQPHYYFDIIERLQKEVKNKIGVN